MSASLSKPPERVCHDPMALVTADVVRAFERDGVVWIPGLISPVWLRLIAQGVERNIRSPGPLGERAHAGEPGEHWGDHLNYFVNPEYQRLLADSPIAAIMAKVLGTKELRLFTDQIFVKEGGYRRPTPWHQDTPWLMADGRQFATMWISLQPLTQDETLEFVAASHRGPMYDHTAVREEALGDRRSQNSAPPLPDIDAD